VVRCSSDVTLYRLNMRLLLAAVVRRARVEAIFAAEKAAFRPVGCRALCDSARGLGRVRESTRGGIELGSVIVRQLVVAAIACAVASLSAAARADDAGEGRVVVRFQQGPGAEEQARFAAAVRAELAGVAPVEVVAPGALVVVRVTWTRGGATLDFQDASGATVAPSRTVVGETADVVAAQAASIVRATAIALREAAAFGRRETGAGTGAGSAPSSASALVPASTSTSTSPSSSTSPSTSPSTPTSTRIPTSTSTSTSTPTSPSNPASTYPSRSESTPGPHLLNPVPRIVLDAFYSGAVYAPDVPWRSGVRLEVLATTARWGRTWLYGGLGYGFDPPIDVATPNVTLRTTRQSATLFAGLGRALGALRVAAEVGAVLSDTLRSATTAAGFDATSDHALVSFGAIARAHASLALWARWHVDLSAGVAAFPWGEVYVVQAGGETSVFAPYRVQPEASLGMGYDLW
jgi:hypothetical protein